MDNGAFGETSCEVCGIFTAYREDTETTSVGRTDAPVITLNNHDIDDVADDISYVDSTVIYEMEDPLVAGYQLEVTDFGNSIVNINGANSSEYTVTENGQYVRIIVQDGTKAPYIVIIK